MSKQTALYLRLSEASDANELGIDRQRLACRALAARHGLDDLTEYVDDGRSAWTGAARPAFERLLADLAAGRLSAVLAFAPDRIARNIGDYAAFTDAARLAGARVILVNGGEVGLDPTSTLSSGVQALVSSWESGIKSVRVKAAAEQRALAGLPPGGPRKYGYTTDHMSLVEVEANAIADAAHAVLDGASLRSQVKRVNADRELWTPARKGRTSGVVERRPWQTTAFRTLLTRPALAGIVVYRGTEYRDVVAQWPTILTTAEHDDLTVMFAGRATGPNDGPGAPAKHLGSGLYRCGAPGCDGTLGTTTQNRPGGRVLLYRCRYAGERQAAQKTPHVARVAARVDDEVIAAVLARLSRGDLQQAIAERAGEDSTALLREREAVRTRMREVADAVVAGAFTPAQAATINRGFMDRLTELDAKVAETDTTGVLKLVGEVGTGVDAADFWQSADLVTRRALVDALVEVTVLPTRRGTRFVADDVDIRYKV